VEQRRVVLFLVLSFLVLMLNSLLFQQERPPAEAPAPQELAAEAGDEAGEEAPAEPPAAPDGENGDSSAELADVPEEQAPEPELEEPPQEIEHAYVTLGSLDPNDPYRLLVTFTNQGAAVRRVELSSDRYRDLHDRSGYLGHLELKTDDQTGLLVQTVGPGTPAAEAGIQKGDRILAIESSEKAISVESTSHFEERLKRFKPGRQITLKVSRGADQGEEQQVDCTATLRRRPLEVLRPESENILMRNKSLPPGYEDQPSFLMTLQQLGQAEIDDEDPEAEEELGGLNLLNSNWEITDQSETSITFRKSLPQKGLEIVKQFYLEKVPADELQNSNYPGYDLRLEMSIRNAGQDPVKLAYRLDGPNGLPLEGWWYAHKVGRSWGAVGLRDIVGRYFNSETTEQTPSDIASGEGQDFEGRSMAYIGVDAQYFAAMMIPEKTTPEEKWLELVRPVLLGPPPAARSSEGYFANVTPRLISRTVNLDAQDTLQHSYTIFTGPKRPELLVNYEFSDLPRYSLGDVMYYGWFGAVAKAMLAILHFFYGIVHNYGLAIIMLTVLVRSCLFPLSRKQAHSMAKMQELRPEMEKIKEKYKSDMQKQSQAMQELYRKYNINPLAGCLPMFIQLPIFLGLYRALMVDVELRQAPLLSESIRWCSNLAAPDMLLNWTSVMPSFITSGVGLFALGPYLNILPLVTVGLFIAQQKMFMPEPTNEQAALQQKIMKYMMLFMGILFYKVASGLCIYFIASSMWGIAERKMLPSLTASGSTGSTQQEKEKPTKPSPRPTNNGQSKTKRSNRSKKKR